MTPLTFRNMVARFIERLASDTMSHGKAEVIVDDPRPGHPSTYRYAELADWILEDCILYGAVTVNSIGRVRIHSYSVDRFPTIRSNTRANRFWITRRVGEDHKTEGLSWNNLARIILTITAKQLAHEYGIADRMVTPDEILEGTGVGRMAYN